MQRYLRLSQGRRLSPDLSMTELRLANKLAAENQDLTAGFFILLWQKAKEKVV